MTTFYKGDAVEMIKKHVKDKSVDLIYFDPPFATTGNWWDESMNWKEVFTECFRALRHDGTLIIHCSVPFNYTLIREAPRPPTYSWYWKKNVKTNFLNVKSQPMRCIEEVLVWKMKKTTYYPQQIGDTLRTISPKSHASETYFQTSVKATGKRKVIGQTRTHLIDMPIALDGFSTRPEDLVKLFIQSYTKEGDSVLDLTCYQGLSGKICKELKRKWTGIDKNFLPSLLIK
jgi:site-specific DNA-methyltransferase (adenine-specific)